MAENGTNKTYYTCNHNNTLHKVGVRGRNISAGNKINSRKRCNNKHPHPSINARENGTEQRAETLINRRRIRNKEHEDDDRRKKLHAL